MRVQRSSGECRQSLDLIVCPAIFDRNIATFGIARLVQTNRKEGRREKSSVSRDPLLSHPITGIGGCCACATNGNGHATTEPAHLMKSRRLIVAPYAQRAVRIKLP